MSTSMGHLSPEFGSSPAPALFTTTGPWAFGSIPLLWDNNAAFLISSVSVTWFSVRPSCVPCQVIPGSQVTTAKQSQFEFPFYSCNYSPRTMKCRYRIGDRDPDELLSKLLKKPVSFQQKTVLWYRTKVSYPFPGTDYWPLEKEDTETDEHLGQPGPCYMIMTMLSPSIPMGPCLGVSQEAGLWWDKNLCRTPLLSLHSTFVRLRQKRKQHMALTYR